MNVQCGDPGFQEIGIIAAGGRVSTVKKTYNALSTDIEELPADTTLKKEGALQAGPSKAAVPKPHEVNKLIVTEKQQLEPKPTSRPNKSSGVANKNQVTQKKLITKTIESIVSQSADKAEDVVGESGIHIHAEPSSHPATKTDGTQSHTVSQTGTANDDTLKQSAADDSDAVNKAKPIKSDTVKSADVVSSGKKSRADEVRIEKLKRGADSEKLQTNIVCSDKASAVDTGDSENQAESSLKQDKADEEIKVETKKADVTKEADLVKAKKKSD